MTATEYVAYLDHCLSHGLEPADEVVERQIASRNVMYTPAELRMAVLEQKLGIKLGVALTSQPRSYTGALSDGKWLSTPRAPLADRDRRSSSAPHPRMADERGGEHRRRRRRKKHHGGKSAPGRERGDRRSFSEPPPANGDAASPGAAATGSPPAPAQTLGAAPARPLMRRNSFSTVGDAAKAVAAMTGKTLQRRNSFSGAAKLLGGIVGTKPPSPDKPPSPSTDASDAALSNAKS